MPKAMYTSVVSQRAMWLGSGLERAAWVRFLTWWRIHQVDKDEAEAGASPRRQSAKCSHTALMARLIQGGMEWEGVVMEQAEVGVCSLRQRVQRVRAEAESP